MCFQEGSVWIHRFFPTPFSLAASQYVGSCPRSSWCYSLHAITCRCLLKRSSGRRGTTGTTGTAGTAGTAGTTGTAGTADCDEPIYLPSGALEKRGKVGFVRFQLGLETTNYMHYYGVRIRMNSVICCLWIPSMAEVS